MRASHSEPETSTTRQCQICFDDLEEDGNSTTSFVTAFCGASCPAVLCRVCIAEHVRVSVEAAFPGVLPNVRCPICLVSVNKSKWAHLASPQVLTKYVQLCRDACSFRTPCCHDTEYTHLPWELNATDLPPAYIQPTALTSTPELVAKLSALHDQTHRFGNHQISSKELMIFIEATFGYPLTAATQHLVVEHELRTILDEARRATLLLSYHAKYKIVTTRCCGERVCFNCKRETPSGKHRCDGRGIIDTSGIIECRACHVTIVKVDGCSTVVCWCGFSMDWDREVSVRDLHTKQLIPVDIYDIATHTAWQTWQTKMITLLKSELLPLRQKILCARLDKVFASFPRVRATARVFLQHWTWRRRFARALPQLETELAEHRLARCVRSLAACASVAEALRRAQCRARWRRVLVSIYAKRFWLRYRSEHGDEQREIGDQAMALLLPGFVASSC